MQNYGRERHRDFVERPSPGSDHRDKSAKNNDILASLKNFGKNKDKQAVRETAKRRDIDETFNRIDTLYQQLDGQRREPESNPIANQERRSQKSVKSQDIKARQQVIINRLEALEMQRDLRDQPSFSRTDNPYSVATSLRDNGVRSQSDHILQSELAEIHQQIEVLKQDENSRRVNKDATRPEATTSGVEGRVDQSSASHAGVDLPPRRIEKNESDAVNIRTKIYDVRGKREKEINKRAGLDELVSGVDWEASNVRGLDPAQVENVQPAQTQRRQVQRKEIRSSKDIRQELNDVRDQLQKLRTERNEERDNAHKELNAFQEKEQAFRSLDREYDSIQSIYQNKMQNLDERISDHPSVLSGIEAEKQRRLQFERASAGVEVNPRNPDEHQETVHYQYNFPREQDHRSDTYQNSATTQADIKAYRPGAEPRRLDEQGLDELNHYNEVNGQDGQDGLAARVQRYFGTMTKEFIREQEHRRDTYQNPATTQADIKAYRQEVEPRRNDGPTLDDQSRYSEFYRQNDFAVQGSSYIDVMRAKFIKEAETERTQNLSHLNNKLYALINDRRIFDEDTSRNIGTSEQAISQLKVQQDAYLAKRKEFKVDWRSRRDQQLSRLERLKTAENERRERRDQRYGVHAQRSARTERMIID